MKYTIYYVLSVVLVNIGFANIPLVTLPWGGKWPPTAMIVGLVFVLRDFSQREISHKVIYAMLVGAVISFFMATPAVAIASVVAYLSSEFMDWAIYSFTKKPFAQRILLSSAISTPIDSIVFLWVIGHLSIEGVLIMTLSKMIAAIIIYKLLNRGHKKL